MLNDQLSKMVHSATKPTSSSAYDMAKLCLHTVIRAHGLQREIVDDRDTLFISALWEELTKTLARFAAYHASGVSCQCGLPVTKTTDDHT